MAVADIDCDQSMAWLCEWVVSASGGEGTLAEVLAWTVNRPLQILLILVVTFVAVRLLRRWIRRGTERLVLGSQRMAEAGLSDDEVTVIRQRAEARASSIGRALAGASAVGIWTLSLLTVLGVSGFDIGPLLAGAGVAGVALGFGAQTLVKDVLAGLFILIEDQFGIGDVVEADGISGTVEALSLRATQIRSIDGTLWFVPNGQIVHLGNMTKSWAMAIVDVGVAYGADLESVRAVLLSAATEVAGDPEFASSVIDEPQVLGVEALAADSVSVRLTLKVVPGRQWAVQRALRERVKAALDAEGIEIPFPQRTVWMRTTGD